ncbi:MAG: hypothetical protein K0S51_837 [Bacillales bacterium]|jgi:hypothetical protein|nr:hypothetical protein [Bacillales bacterium]
MILKFVSLFLGLLCLYFTFHYSKDYHQKRFLNDSSGAATSDSIIASLFIFVLGLLPWYFTRFLIFSVSLAFFYIFLFVRVS